MINLADTPWLQLVFRCLRWLAVAEKCRDPESVKFARAVARASAMRLVEPEQGLLVDAARTLRVEKKFSRKKICRRGRRVAKLYGGLYVR